MGEIVQYYTSTINKAKWSFISLINSAKSTNGAEITLFAFNQRNRVKQLVIHGIDIMSFGSTIPKMQKKLRGIFAIYSL